MKASLSLDGHGLGKAMRLLLRPVQTGNACAARVENCATIGPCTAYALTVIEADFKHRARESECARKLTLRNDVGGCIAGPGLKLCCQEIRNDVWVS